MKDMKSKGSSMVESAGPGIHTGKQKTGDEPFGAAKTGHKFGTPSGGKKSGEYKGDKKNSQGY